MSFWQDKVVLCTGGTGTFGNAFCRRMLEEPIRKFVVYSRDEAKQEDFRAKFLDERVRTILGDVRDLEHLRLALRGADVVVNAAALKRVPALEYSPDEALKTNVLGTDNVIHAALDSETVQQVMLISTDKACYPHNVYGKSKAFAESLVLAANSYSGGFGPVFSAVRYGNVAGSRGSIIPKLIEQKASGNVTLTDSRMSRYWLTIGQAVEFTKTRIEASDPCISVPVIPSVWVSDVIQAVAPDAHVTITGIRPGEKLSEVLVTREESVQAVKQRAGPLDFYRIGQGYEPGPEFQYDSLSNDQWLSVDEIRRAIPAAMAEAS